MNRSQQVSFFQQKQGAKYQDSSYGEFRVSKSRWNIIDNLFWNIGRSVYECREENWSFLHWESFCNKKSFDWYFDRGIEACSYGWQLKMNLNVEKNYLWRLFLKIPHYQNCDATNKIHGFSPQYSYASALFQIEFLMEDLELVVAEDYFFE